MEVEVERQERLVKRLVERKVEKQVERKVEKQEKIYHKCFFFNSSIVPRIVLMPN